MTVLIVEDNAALGGLWQRQLADFGTPAIVSSSQDDAIQLISKIDFAVIVLNLDLADGGAMAVADYASYRRPDSGVIFVSNTSAFSDGSIFSHAANARAMVPSHTNPRDIAEMVNHFTHDRSGRPEVDSLN